jgi:hypothetical protein
VWEGTRLVAGGAMTIGRKEVLDWFFFCIIEVFMTVLFVWKTK